MNPQTDPVNPQTDPVNPQTDPVNPSSDPVNRHEAHPVNRHEAHQTTETLQTLTIRLPDGSTKQLPQGSRVGDLAHAVGRRLAEAAVAAKVDGRDVDLSTRLAEGDTVEVLTVDSPSGREVIRHSTAHVMAQAVLRLWPGAHYAIGPVVEDGFYYDFELPDGQRFHDGDLERIESSMRQIIAEDQPFWRQEHTFDEGLALFGDQPFKREIIERVAQGATEVDADIEPGGTVSTYRNSDAFIDLCRGPHVPSTKRLGHFKLMRVAGAYWRGDERRPQLQRIYGTAWESGKALAAHLRWLEEAERRDHRRLGAELDLFSFPDELGPGLAVLHPRGGTIRRLMEDYSRQRHVDAGYEFVSTPHITKADLFKTSGHLDFFADGMFPPMELDGGQQYFLKPMNCPFHILVFKSRQRSYRELPLRLFELGTVYRYEKSGVLHGLTRVRGMTQDDAHIFCTQEQTATELDSALRFLLDVLRAFGLDDFYLELSTRPEDKAVGSVDEWGEATQLLQTTADSAGLELVLDEGGGAFYGPKISVQARDAIGRSHQISTIQLDVQLPHRFDIEYVGADNGRHRPVMIHRALFGTVERFMAILLEHHAGALPTWLAPEQVKVLPVRDANEDYAAAAAARLRAAGVRTSVVPADEPLNARVRRAKLEKLPYVVVVGDDDVAETTVGVNPRGSSRAERGVPIEDFVTALQAEIAAHGSPERSAPTSP